MKNKSEERGGCSSEYENNRKVSERARKMRPRPQCVSFIPNENDVDRSFLMPAVHKVM